MQQSLSSSKYTTTQYNIDLEENGQDPVLQNYFRTVVDIVIPLQIREQKGGKTLNDIGIMQILRLRVMSGIQKQSQQVKLQLTSQDDLFFNFTYLVDKKQFNKLKKQQNLTIGFQNFIQMMNKLTKMIHSQKNTHFAIFCIRRDKTAHLDFNQSVGYKVIEVLSLPFNVVDQELNKQIVSYRFNLVKRKLKVLNTSLTDVFGVLKLKNPSLHLKLTKKNQKNN